MEASQTSPDEGSVTLDYEDLWNEDRHVASRRAPDRARHMRLARGVPWKRKH